MISGQQEGPVSRIQAVRHERPRANVPGTEFPQLDLVLTKVNEGSDWIAIRRELGPELCQETICDRPPGYGRDRVHVRQQTELVQAVQRTQVEKRRSKTTAGKAQRPPGPFSF